MQHQGFHQKKQRPKSVAKVNENRRMRCFLHKKQFQLQAALQDFGKARFTHFCAVRILVL